MSKLFRPSASKRWINCIGSQAMERDTKQESSLEASRGTAAHWLSEQVMKGGYALVEGERIDLNKGYNVITVDNEMIEAVELYTNHLKDLEKQGYILFIEQELSMKRLINKDVWGTADCIAVNFETNDLQVHDLKYGFSPVPAEGNTQLLMYLIASFGLFDVDFEPITMSCWIHQPRVSEKPKVWDVSFAEINNFKQVVKTAVTKFDNLTPDNLIDSLSAGEHCTWCSARFHCPALRDTAINAMVDDAVTLESLKERIAARVKEMDNLTPYDISNAYKAMDVIKIWMKAIDELAYKTVNKEELPDFKLVAPRDGNRKWNDEDGVFIELSRVFKRHEITESKLISPAQFDKLVKKSPFKKTLKEKVNSYIVREPGSKPLLVPASDKREAWNGGISEDDFEILEI